MSEDTCLHVRGYRILVRPDVVETETASGIVITLDTKLEEAAQQLGKVVGIGHTAWKTSLGCEPWCAVGDRILFSKYAGRLIDDPITGEQFMTINDEDVICVVGDKENG